MECTGNKWRQFTSWKVFWAPIIQLLFFSFIFSFLCFFLGGGFFIYISNVIPFPSPSPETPYSISLPLFLWGCSPTHTPTPGSLPWNSPILGHGAFTGPRASPAIDDPQGYPLLHMWLEPWIPPCVFSVWWFSPWELGVGGGVMVDWYCSSCGVAIPFRSFSPFSNSSTGDPVLSSIIIGL
jgi:hypothetical protein